MNRQLSATIYAVAGGDTFTNGKTLKGRNTIMLAWGTVTRINPGFGRTTAGKGLRRIMREYDAKSWAPYGSGGAILYDRNGRELLKVSASQIRSWAR